MCGQHPSPIYLNVRGSWVLGAMMQALTRVWMTKTSLYDKVPNEPGLGHASVHTSSTGLCGVGSGMGCLRFSRVNRKMDRQ